MNDQTLDLSEVRLLTLADMAAVIDTAPSCSARHRAAMLKALSTVAKALDQSPHTVDYDPRALRAALGKALPGALDCDPQAWARTVQLLDDAARACGLPPLARHRGLEISSDWTDVLLAVEDRNDRYQLRLFAAFCSENRFAERDVADEIIARFFDVLRQRRVQRPRQVVRDVVRVLNVRRKAAGSPALQLPFQERETSLPLSAFPDAFSDDVRAYLDHRAGLDLLSETARRPASAMTLRNEQVGIRQMATALVRSGRDIRSIQLLADLVDLPSAEAILKAAWDKAGKRPSGLGHNQGRLLVQIARHWVGAPGDVLKRLSQLTGRLRPPKDGLTEKNKARLRVLKTEANLRALAQLPRRILEEALVRPASVENAAAVQAGVAVALLLTAPIRGKNLAELHRDRSFTAAGNDGSARLSVEAFRVKNKQAIEFVVSATVMRLVDIYMERFQPLLAGRDNRFLFPNRSGKHKAPSALSGEVPKVIKAMTGLDMNLHLARHLAADLFLRAHPGEYETIRRLLGHKSIKTTTEFYADQETETAYRRYDALMDKYRDDEEGE